MASKVLIIGGGYAGVEAALTLNKLKNKKKQDVEITLVDRNDYHTLLTELHEVAGNRIAEDGIIIPFDRIFKYTDVRYVTDEITSYDFEAKKISSPTRTFEYDYLIMAMGSKPNYYGIEGLDEHAFTLWSYDDALRIRENIYDCFKLARQEENEEERRRLLTFVVAGAGFTGIEMIGEIAVWVKKLCKEYGVDRNEVRLIVIDMLPRVLSVLSEKNSKKAHDFLVNKLNVEIILNSSVCDVSEKGFSTGKEFIPTATLIWACGVCAVDAVNGFDIEKVNGRRLKVDDYCETKYSNVFAVGDISGFKGEKEIPYPAMVENAIQTAHGVAVNIINDLLGKEREKVEVKMHGVMVCIGNNFAVSDIMGREFGRVMSVVMKYMVNIHYLWEITGFYGIAKYIYHEVLENKSRKNIVEQHYSVRNQTWWLVPGRIFLGAIWLYEGIKKIGDGWLKSAKLNGFFGGADSFYEGYLNPATYVPDTTSGATGAGGGGEVIDKAKDVLMNWDWGWIKFIAVKADEIAFKIDFYPMTWIKDNFLLANNGTQMFFQWFVVLAEIIVGLCLIGGAFNFIASGFSIVLLVSFLMTTGLYMQSQWWMLFLSFAVMAGAGRAFGLDHYIMPYLNNYWERIWKSKKWCPVFKRSLDRYNKN